jgi:hypothetical protein
MRKFAKVLFGAAVLFGSNTAFAQEFGSKGDVAFAAERLFSIHGTHTDEERADGNDRDVDHTGIGFGWQGQAIPSPHDVPRLGFDFFVIDRLSIGGTIAYATTSVEYDDDGDTDAAYFLLSPRVGYAYMFSRVFGIWPRGGVAYHSMKVEDDTWNGFGFSFECMFPISPTPHFAFEIGPTFDFDFTGSFDPDNGPDGDFKQRAIGLRFGLLGWL